MYDQNKLSEKKAMRVSKVSIIVNLALALAKLFAGIFASSMALISDAIHSASDVFSTFVVMIGIKIAARESDEEHPYGHERLECVAAIVLAVVLFITGGSIGLKGLKDICTGDYNNYVTPGILALAAALLSIFVKEWMYHYTRRCAKEIKSSALMADAWHHRSDALSSIGSFVGVLGARMGYLIMDSVASVIICIFIIKAAVDIFLDATGKMVDKACDEATINKISELIKSVPGVMGIDLLRTRMFGNHIYVDVEISADGNLSLFDSHAVAESVHDRIESEITDVKHIMVHVNPYKNS